MDPEEKKDTSQAVVAKIITNEEFSNACKQLRQLEESDKA